MGLGRTSGQRSAEMVAGLRAELDPSPVNQALSRFAGRLTARIMLKLMRDKSLVNFLIARPAAFSKLLQRHLGQNGQKAVIV